MARAGESCKPGRAVAFSKAGAGILDDKSKAAIGFAANRKANATFLGEFDRVTSKVEQHLPHPRCIADDACWQRDVNKSRKIEPFRCGLPVENINAASNQSARIKRFRDKIDEAFL